MPDEDLMSLGQEAMEEAREGAVDAVRFIKAQIVNRPAFARKLPRAERLEGHRGFLRDSLVIATRYDELAAQFQLPPEKPVPKRLVDYGRLIKRELARAEEGD